MATVNVSPLSSHTQSPEASCPLHAAIIQQPTRKWEKPWRHQRVIVLFASSPEVMKLRLQLEGRLKPGEQVLRIVAVSE